MHKCVRERGGGEEREYKHLMRDVFLSALLCLVFNVCCVALIEQQIMPRRIKSFSPVVSSCMLSLKENKENKK